MGKKLLPNRWLHYKPIGKIIHGTRFLPFKVPLRDDLSQHLPLEKQFSPSKLINMQPNLSLVIDLTTTSKYYSYQDFLLKGIAYVQILCPAKKTPKKEIVENFFEVVDQFNYLSQSKDELIGVHCAHGVNRTGYLICMYMIMKQGIEPKEAMSKFKEGRGHKIERKNYVAALLATKAIKSDLHNPYITPTE